MRLMFLAIFILTPAPALFAAEPVRISLASREEFINLPVIIDLKKFITDALKQEDILVTYVPLPVQRGTSMAESGELDGEMIREKEALVGLTHLITSMRPLAIVPVKVIYARENKKYSRTRLKELRCGTLLNSQAVHEMLVADDIQCTEIKTPSQALRILAAGRLDYVVLPVPIAMAVLEKNTDWKKSLIMDEKDYMNINLYIVLNKKHAELMPKVEKALRSAIKTELPKYKLLQKGINPNF